MFYGQRIQSKDIDLGGISVNKAVKNAMTYMSISRIGLNLFSSVGNIIGATSNLLIEGQQGRFNQASLKKTIKYISENFDNISSLEEYFGIEDASRLEANKFSKTKWDKYATQDKWFFMMKYPDKAIKLTILVNMMSSYGLDEKGKITKLDMLPKDSKSLLDLWKIDKQGNIELGNITIEQSARFRRMISKEIDRIIGASNEETLRLYKTNLGMLILMQFKNWLPGLASARFSKLKFDYDFEEFTEGRFKATFSNLWSGKDSYLSKTIKTFGFVASHIPLLGYFSKYIPSLGGLKKTDEQIAQMQFESFYRENKDLFKDMSYKQAFDKFVANRNKNIKSFGRELQIMLGFMMLLLILGNAGDYDEDKEMRKTFYYKMLNRGALELGFFFNPNDTYKIIKRPLPLLGLINDILDLKMTLPMSSTIKQLGEQFTELTQKEDVKGK